MMKSETQEPQPDLPGTTTNNHVQMVLAKALFDNIAETPDELAFRRGDIITIVDQNPPGLDGWSLCSFRGKQGIAPTNRLQIIAAANLPDGVDLDSAIPENNVKWKRRSWHLCPDKVMTPEKLGEIYVYQQPDLGIQDYDIPPSRYFPPDVTSNARMVNKSQSFDSADSALKLPPMGSLSQYDIYDVPPSGRNEIYDVPPSASTRVSTGSTVSSSLSIPNFNYGGMVSGPSSSCGSARSSIDIPAQDIYDIPPSQRGPCRSPMRSPVCQSGMETYDTPPSKFGTSLDIYDTPPSKLKNISLDTDYASPLKSDVSCDGDEVYDIPPSKLFPTSQAKSDPNKRGVSADSGFEIQRRGDVYDVPHPSSLEHVIDELYDVPPNNMQKLQYGQKAGHIRHKSNELLDVSSVYDIPPQVTRDSAISMRSESSSVLDDLSCRLSSCSMDSRGSSELPAIPYEELRLDLDSAMEVLVKLQQEVQGSNTKLLSFVSSSWRKKENLEPKLYDVQMSCKRFNACLKEFVEFGQGAIANSAKAEDKKLVKKLMKQLKPLQDALQTVSKRIHHLDVIGWQIDKLTEPIASTDDLGRIVEVATEVLNEVRSVASLLQGNSTLLFKRAQKLDGLDEQPLSTSTPVKAGPPTLPKPVRKSLSRKESAIQERPLPAPPVKESTSFESDLDMVDDGKPRIYEEPKKPDGSEYEEKIVDDYDYVHLQNRPSTLKRNKRVNKEIESEQDSSTSAGLSAQFSERLAQAQRNTVPVERRPSRRHSTLHDNDRQMLSFYAQQIELQSQSLVNTIDTFFQCIEYNQPPKIFVAHSKFVILGAHKMVYIGDTLHRNVMYEDVRIKIMACANYLCDCLKAAVISTKHAALQYPSVPAVQTMVDRIVDVSHASNELKLVIVQASRL